MNIDKMLALAEQLKTRPSIQVGVFVGGAAKNKSARDKGPARGRDKGPARGRLTNADLAAIHEHGAPEVGIPARSMLHVPIHDHAKDIMDPARGKAEELLKSGGALRLWKTVGIAGEKVVLGAFSTGGYGKWAPLKRATLLAKLKGSLKKRRGQIAQIVKGESGMEILIDTRQLSRAFSSRVRMGY